MVVEVRGAKSAVSLGALVLYIVTEPLAQLTPPKDRCRPRVAIEASWSPKRMRTGL